MNTVKKVKNFLARPESLKTAGTENMEVSTFYIGNYLFGIDINIVQEINTGKDFTPVPHAAGHITGVMNLRGQIVTVIDMRKVLGIENKDHSSEERNIIIESEGELIGLLVDKISDVLEIKSSAVEQPPRLRSMDMKFVKGVFPVYRLLLLLLNINEVVSL